LQLLQNAVEALEARLPARAISLEPRIRLGKWLSLQTTWSPLCILTNCDQPGALQDLQVLEIAG
jgi:hypothetical protein